jgi:hypothetical protein
MEPHAPTHATGKIILPDMRSVSCTILDISDKGAALKVSSVLGIPDTFDILIGPGVMSRHCRVTRTYLKIADRA